jgi:hypothetical protein
MSERRTVSELREMISDAAASERAHIDDRLRQRAQVARLAIANGGIVERDVFFFAVHGFLPNTSPVEMDITLKQYGQIERRFGMGTDGEPIVQWVPDSFPRAISGGGVLPRQKYSPTMPPHSPLRYVIVPTQGNAFEGQLQLPLAYGQHAHPETGVFTGPELKYFTVARAGDAVAVPQRTDFHVEDHSAEFTCGTAAIYAAYDVGYNDNGDRRFVAQVAHLVNFARGI